LAEDNSVNQRVAMRILEKWGCRANVVGDGSEVLQELSRLRYDVVLMDCQMPVTDGYDATREIRRLEEGTGRRIPIIAMTANSMFGDRERCIEAGMDWYISKPIRLEELAKALLWASETRAAANGSSPLALPDVAGPLPRAEPGAAPADSAARANPT